MSKISEYSIVISANANTSERRAASFVRQNVRLVCGRTLPIKTDAEPAEPCEIVVGRTCREQEDGVVISRSRKGVWEYRMFTVGKRFYMTGLGIAPEEPPYRSAYRKLDDGGIGTVLAAYHFVEDVLGYQFIYSTYDCYPETPELEMPEDYRYEFTAAAFREQRPVDMAGSSIHFLQCSVRLDWNNQSVIIKTCEGRLIVIDGGHPEETDRFLEALRVLSGREIPHVSAWLFTHLHGDHYGVYTTLCNDEKYRGAVTVERFYCNLPPEEFYTTLSKETNPAFADVRRILLDSGSTIGASVITVQRGDIIEVDDVSFEVLHVPEESHYRDMNMNDSSVVYKMTHRPDGQTIMFLGDAEWVCDNDLVENCAHKLKSNVVQVGHHGCGNVSRKCYELIDADAYLWPIGARFWYGESGEGLNTHNTGVERMRVYMRELGVDIDNVYINMDSILSFPLPMPIKKGDKK